MQERSECGTTLPRLFIYNLPKEYYSCVDVLHLLDGSGLPRVIQNSSSSRPQLRQANGYALGGVFLTRANSYSCRTLSERDADLFFVPVVAESIIAECIGAHLPWQYFLALPAMTVV